MTYEPGSLECKHLIDAKDSLLNVLKSLNTVDGVEPIKTQLMSIYQRLEEMHEERREKEKAD